MLATVGLVARWARMKAAVKRGYGEKKSEVCQDDVERPKIMVVHGLPLYIILATK